MNVRMILGKLRMRGTQRPRRFSFAFYLWVGIAYVLAVCLMILLIKVAFSGRELTQQAIRNGQRVVIDVASGGVEGGNTAEPVTNIQNTTETGEQHPVKTVPVANETPDKQGMMPVPLEGLVETTDKGALPIAGSDGTLPWKYYARPGNTKSKLPMVAIVFTNIGLNEGLTQDVLKLSPELTLGFSPYANDSGKLAFRARRGGFESVVDLPVQTLDYPFSDPGVFGLMDDLSPDENIRRMHQILYQFPGYIGMLASVGETMTSNKEEIKPYLVEMKKRGLLFLYVKTPKNADLEDFAKINGFYTLGIDDVIDTTPSKGFIDQHLQSLVDTAKKQGYAVGLAHSYPPTTAELSSWIDSLQGQGVVLVPVSAIARKVLP